jgi:hypothetical protein
MKNATMSCSYIEDHNSNYQYQHNPMKQDIIAVAPASNLDRVTAYSAGNCSWFSSVCSANAGMHFQTGYNRLFSKSLPTHNS